MYCDGSEVSGEREGLVRRMQPPLGSNLYSNFAFVAARCSLLFSAFCRSWPWCVCPSSCFVPLFHSNCASHALQFANTAHGMPGMTPNARVSDANEVNDRRDWARHWPFLEIVRDVPACGEVLADYPLPGGHALV